jgi:hypothetical protein
LINLFDVDPKDHQAFVKAWPRTPCSSSGSRLHLRPAPSRDHEQLHVPQLRGLRERRAVRGNTEQPEFRPLRGVYPDSATAHANLFRRVFPGICTGQYL